MDAPLFVMAGGGTGGHVFPLLAVAAELKKRGHEILFVGTRKGLEAKLAPEAGYPIEFVEVGALKRVGIGAVARTLWQLPRATLAMRRMLKRKSPAAVFSLGGYAAGPVAAAAALAAVPLVLMEPNVAPGFTNRLTGRWAARSLLAWPESERYFPRGTTEVTGLPIREAFFQIPEWVRKDNVQILVTGGSQGSRRLNLGLAECWPLLREAKLPVRIVHQTGPGDYERIKHEFQATGLPGQVAPFINDMPAAFAAADLIISRAGAGTVAEIAAAGRPSILVPFPYAADDHQTRNAQVLVNAGAAVLIPDREFTGQRLLKELTALTADPGRLPAMATAARKLARTGSARRAADILEEISRARIDTRLGSRNNKTELERDVF
jgi:UDP-N-acetylglucosamine--N-acetylmuramyl-(pentapeptide) pyrophosphoryl-undecaprenol N-acetylglucosamine transferase